MESTNDGNELTVVSRRDFLRKTAATTVAATAGSSSAGGTAQISRRGPKTTETISLCGPWKFRLDAENAGIRESWFAGDHGTSGWLDVEVPHTWQIEARHAEYRGIAWYMREFDALEDWREDTVRIEFEAVFHSATVWVNGRQVGDHPRKGYTAFTLDITHALLWGRPNTVAVRVDNAFNEQMLPRGRSSDWANDGGIFRPVQLLVTPKVFLDRAEVSAVPDAGGENAALAVTANIRNTNNKAWSGVASIRVVDDGTGLTVPVDAEPIRVSVPAGGTHTATFRSSLNKPKLWHFDAPHLYRVEVSISNESDGHQLESTFGARNFEAKNGRLYLNGEPVRLMGVERMAGSHPSFGMAEPAEWIEHDHREMKDLNCVFTRVHWPQDKRVLDYCDRYGILMQSEIPAWGPDTFQGAKAEPDPEILENGLEQLREMIARDRNHPCIVAWGLCNETGGQSPPAFKFAKRLLEEAKRLDPERLCSYASNSLISTPSRDAAGMMDFIEDNEYFETWMPGSTEDAAKHLDQVHAAFPDKPIVISEYGYCACVDDRREGDEHRVKILRTHDAVFRSKSFIGGAIFFCYNDYRTHAGDRGVGALQQRVHGVVDLFGTKKRSYGVLREEASPIAFLTVENELNKFRVRLQSRDDLPAYTLRGYTLRAVFYGQGNIAVEIKTTEIPELAPGKSAGLALAFTSKEVPLTVHFDVVRPTGFSAYSVEWRP